MRESIDYTENAKVENMLNLSEKFMFAGSVGKKINNDCIIARICLGRSGSNLDIRNILIVSTSPILKNKLLK